MTQTQAIHYHLQPLQRPKSYATDKSPFTTNHYYQTMTQMTHLAYPACFATALTPRHIWDTTTPIFTGKYSPTSRCQPMMAYWPLNSLFLLIMLPVFIFHFHPNYWTYFHLCHFICEIFNLQPRQTSSISPEWNTILPTKSGFTVDKRNQVWGDTKIYP